MPTEAIIQSAISRLSSKEKEAYERYLLRGDPPLAPAIQAQLFELYLNGSNTEEIAKLNKHFSLGMIVRAKVEGLWDERKAAHISTLLDSVRERVQQVQLESVVFAADLLAAANKRYGERLKKYIQTGDESELGDISISSLKQYKEAVALLLTLTGQDKESKVRVSGETTTTVEVKAAKPLTPQEAAAILALAERNPK